MSNYKQLVVWQKAFDLVKEVYILTSKFPVDERYGLVSQMRRAAVSIPSNIAEGRPRHTLGEFIQFVSHAEGSAAELETQILLSRELGYSPDGKVQKVFDDITEVHKMLGSLRRKLVSGS